MVIVEENKRKRKYKMPDMPKFGSKEYKMAWLLREKKKATLLNVKSVSVQVKDIKMMIYSNKIRLISLSSIMSFRQELNNNEEYITIRKTSDLNKSTMYEILEADWLLKANELDEMSIELVEAKKKSDECQLQVVKELKEKYPYLRLNNKIKLLEYKIESLNEYLVNREGKVKKLS